MPSTLIDLPEYPGALSTLFHKSILPYVGVQFNKQITFPNGRKFRVITYQAYNARGMIGTEHNGVAVLDEDNCCVVCDEINKQSTGFFGASQKQWDKAKWLCSASWEEFVSYLNNHSRCRMLLKDTEPEIKIKRKHSTGTPSALDPKYIRVFTKLAVGGASYQAEKKAKFHRMGGKILEFIHSELERVCKKKILHELRHNQGGIAVSGEITLHTETLYVQLSISGGSGLRFLYRSCKGIQDYVGGCNQYASCDELYHMPNLLDRLKRAGNL